MSKTHALFGYSIIAVVLVTAMFVLSQLAASPWLNTVAAALAIAAAVRFVEPLSVMVVGGLVAVLTVGLPLLMLFAMAANSGLSPLAYFKLVDVVQAVFPTLTAVVLLVLLKKWKRTQGMDS